MREIIANIIALIYGGGILGMGVLLYLDNGQFSILVVSLFLGLFGGAMARAVITDNTQMKKRIQL
jgi:hypothetical protein